MFFLSEKFSGTSLFKGTILQKLEFFILIDINCFSSVFFAKWLYQWSRGKSDLDSVRFWLSAFAIPLKSFSFQSVSKSVFGQKVSKCCLVVKSLEGLTRHLLFRYGENFLDDFMRALSELQHYRLCELQFLIRIWVRLTLGTNVLTRSFA